MTTRTHKETSSIERDGLTLTRLLCFIGAAILLLSALYLIFGAFFFVDTSWHLFPADLEERTFGDTILFAAIIGAMVFFFWLAAYGDLIRSRMVCASCHHDLSEVACPECGRTRENIPSGMSDKTVPHDSSQQVFLAVSKLRGIRFMGGVLLAIAALFLLLIGIFDHVPTSLMQEFAKTPGELLEVFSWGARFQNGVAVAVLLAVVGFFIWFIPYRRLARATWLCPSCHYDLSGLPCPKCNEVPATE